MQMHTISDTVIHFMSKQNQKQKHKYSSTENFASRLKIKYKALIVTSLLYVDGGSFDLFGPTKGQFAAKCEAARMRVSLSKSEAVVLCWKILDWVGIGLSSK